ncbi:hypothetical protein ACWDYJ_12055 [Streptomyces sp. NPDC003042]
MADLYALDLALDLDESTAEPALALIRWHLSDDPEALLSASGPAYRVGGTLTAELVRTPAGWSFTARQEIHTESLPELAYVLTTLAPHITAPDPIGALRFYEELTPQPITLDADGTVRLPEG